MIKYNYLKRFGILYFAIVIITLSLDAYNSGTECGMKCCGKKVYSTSNIFSLNNYEASKRYLTNVCCCNAGKVFCASSNPSDIYTLPVSFVKNKTDRYSTQKFYSLNNLVELSGEFKRKIDYTRFNRFLIKTHRIYLLNSTLIC